ncbi:MAG: hypothetical protein GXO30_02330 [Epsilonproteobacteria bacterium]|nr:hypothetical protein [Campylobacterota bacterium]
MSKPIEINFTWSKELALKASKLYYDYDMKASSKRYVGWLFVAMMQFGVVGALKHDSFGLLFISTFLVLYWYYGRWYLRKGMIEKYYDKSKLDATDVKFILKDEGLYYDENLIDWNDIEKVIKFDDGVLLQTTSNTLFFESSSFKSYDEVKTFLKLMKNKGKV